ncbi:hypothetical protein DAPPUDRAFT_243327 [Daphnia pulex]|uniref:Uncharacterized protein n=1 Tax=Daphnia pulex TaxID=6669 RepID=E9GIH4_DAPPU|nr:hypothetical protein DAPPUDRAFT_243327 [Daphnia pulex]|eukprot:EFX80763.1 hypothetical protein DAPPUDRAFT_243327 [Daphnia pulex]
MTGMPSLNDVYTSISNRLDVISMLNKVCRDGEATVAPGTITSLSNTTVVAPRICRFTIVAPLNKRVQLSCPVSSIPISLFELNPFISTIVEPAIINKVYTSTGNEMKLLLLHPQNIMMQHNMDIFNS